MDTIKFYHMRADCVNAFANRYTMPEDVANTLLFVALDESRAITGLIIVTDFGSTLCFENRLSLKAGEFLFSCCLEMYIYDMV